MTRYLVIGSGISGRAAIRYLHNRKATAILYDDNPNRLPADKLITKIDRLDKLLQIMTADDQLVLSPAIALDHPLVQEARRRRIAVCSEVELGLTEFTGQLVAVTGTNGKSTVVAMIDHLLRKLGKDSRLAGNIGLPVTDLIVDHKPEMLVLELSSFQLEQITSLSPEIVILTNLVPDHLDRHHGFEQYSAVKQRLLKLLPDDKVALIGAGVYRHLSSKNQRQLIIIDYQQVAGTSQYLIDGQNVYHKGQLFTFNKSWRGHQLHNALLATVCVQQLTSRPFSQLVPLLSSYQGLPYRLQVIGDKDGHLIINDAKATNLSATLSALQMQNKPVILMLGGQRKQESFRQLLDYREKIIKLIIFGECAPELTAELSAYFKIKKTKTLAEALATIGSLSAPLLFSPACASDCEFADFVARGKYFSDFFEDNRKINGDQDDDHVV